MSQDQGDGRLHVRKHFTRGDAEGAVALRHQPFVARFIAGGVSAAIMRFAVDLYGEAGFETGEVEDERAGGVLPAEFEAAGAVAEFALEQGFGKGHGAAQFARFRDCCARSCEHCASPSAAVPAVRLPVPGRIFYGMFL